VTTGLCIAREFSEGWQTREERPEERWWLSENGFARRYYDAEVFAVSN
jgi:hypothetical protein